MFVAGEASGDTHGAGVARELQAAGTAVRLVGVGGNEMRSAGVELIEHVDNLAVMGFVEVLKLVPKHWALLNRIRERLESGSVKLIILVDYPEFNLHWVAAAAKAAGVPVLYYITPQVWAWRAGRVKTMAATVTKAAVIFGFEEELLRKDGVDAVFVGHPLLDRAATIPSREEARRSLGIGGDQRLLALFPGSRAQEIERHLDAFVATARRLQEMNQGLRVVVSGAPTVTIDPARCPFPVVVGSSFTVLRAADAAICKSGTTTLEAAVAGCPFVIGYRTGALDYAIASKVVTVPDIGMVNVVAGKRIVPEFVQSDLDPERMIPVVDDLLDPASPRRAQMIAGLNDVRSRLGTPGAAKRVATIALEIAGRTTASA